MKIFLKVKPNSKQEKVEKIDKDHFNVWFKAPPKQGRANKRLVKLLSEFFNLSKSKIIILSGLKSKNKIVFLDL